MHASTLHGVLNHLRKLTDPARVRELSDAELLERFRLHHEEAAFTLLVQRHGPMVLAVCRRILGDAHEAEDVFQATFLVLLRKAATIRKQRSVSSWLHIVATRLAQRARAQSARRQACEREVVPLIQSDDSFSALTAAELRAALDEEIERLPAKYRLPLVLCYLSDKTHEQAANELGWPKSSVTARLAKARELLQRRLRHRGFTVPASLLVVLLTEAAANAALPSLLALSTVRLAVQTLTGKVVTATAAAALAGRFVKGAALGKWAAGLTLLATLGFAAVVGSRLAVPGSPMQHEKSPPKAHAARDPRSPKAETRKPRVDLFGDPLPPGARARLGTIRLRHGSAIEQFAFAPDGKVVATASRDNRVCLWEVPTGREIRRLENATVGVADPGVAFSPDGKILATGWDAEVRRWDTENWKELPRWRLKSGRAGRLSFSPNGQTLACIGHTRDKEGVVNVVAFLDTSTGRELYHLDGRRNYRAPSIAFAPDSKTWAYVDCHDKTIGLYDVRTGKEIRRFEGHSKGAWTVSFSPDGKTLASTDHYGGTLRFWNTTTGELLPQRGRFAGSSLAFFPDGKRLLGWSGAPFRYDIAAGKMIPTAGPRWDSESPAILSPDGAWLAWSHRQSLHLWDAATFKPLRPVTAHEQQIESVAFSPDGKVVVSAAGDSNLVRRWDAVTGQALSPFRDIGDNVYALAYSPDGQTLAVGIGGHGGAIQMLEAATGKRLRSLVVPGDQYIVVSLAFSADGRTLLSVQGKHARLWDVATGKILRTIQGDVFPYGPRILALSPNGRIIADGGGFDVPRMIRLRQAATGKEIRTLQNQEQVTALAFSPDGKTLASGAGDDATVKLWDVAAGTLLWQAKGRQREIGIYFLAFSPDGKTLAAGDTEGAILLWEAKTGKERWRFEKHRNAVLKGAFSRDGKLLATGGPDTTILIWDLATAAGPPRQPPLSAKELDALWADLAGDDARKAFQAIHRLSVAPEQTLPFLRQHLKPVPAPDFKQVRQLVEALDSVEFPTRQKAAEELEKLPDSAVGLIRQIVANEKPTLEVRRRLQQILESIESKPESLRSVRAVEVLEWIATPEAVRLIDELANGATEARLTREAMAARGRMRK